MSVHLFVFEFRYPSTFLRTIRKINKKYLEQKKINCLIKRISYLISLISLNRESKSMNKKEK